jgi:hypothetical protein
VLVVFAVIALVIVVLVALVAVGGVVGRLEAEPARNVFDNNESVEFVAQALPESLTAELSYDEVQRILRLHNDYLHARGVSRSGGDLGTSGSGGPQVIDADDGIAYVLERASYVGYFPRPDAVRAVIAAQLAYFEAIGAVAEVEPPELVELEAEGLGVDDEADTGPTDRARRDGGASVRAFDGETGGASTKDREAPSGN